MNVDGRHSGFAVPGVLEAKLTPHVDPVSGKDNDVRISLPNGFIWKTAHAVKTLVMKIMSPQMNFDYAGRNAFFSEVTFEGP